MEHTIARVLEIGIMMNKKLLILLVAVLCLTVACFGCNKDGGNDANGGQEINGEQEGPSTTPGGESNGEASGGGMSRINIFETGAAGIDTTEIDYKDEAVAAYAVKDYVDKNFKAAPTSEVTMIATDGYSVAIDAGEFMEDFIIMELDISPVSVNSKAKYVQYIKTDNESVCFVGDSLKVDDIFAALDMEEAANYNFVASDGFAMEVSKGEIADCTLTSQDGNVNAAIPALSGGDLRELLYIEVLK